MFGVVGVTAASVSVIRWNLVESSHIRHRSHDRRQSHLTINATEMSSDSAKPRAPVMGTPRGSSNDKLGAGSESTTGNAHSLVLEHVTSTTRLMEKRRQTLIATKDLETRRQLWVEQEVNFSQRESLIKKKDLELQDNLVRFGKFLQENDGKRVRAKRRAADEINLRLRKEREIESLTRKLNRIGTNEEIADTSLEKNERYGAYLELVLEFVSGHGDGAGTATTSMGFREVNDVLARHATLQSTNETLTAAHRRFAAEDAVLKTSFSEYVDTQKDNALTLNNEIALLKKQLEKAVRVKEETRAQRDSSLRSDALAKMQHGRVCMATENLFRRCRARSAVKYKTDDNPLERLKVIGEYMGDLNKIVKQRYKENPGLTD